MFDPRFLDNFELFDGPLHRPETRARARHPILPTLNEVDELRMRIRNSSGTTPSAVVPFSTPIPLDNHYSTTRLMEARRYRSRRDRERLRVLRRNIQTSDVGPYPSEPPIAVAWPRYDPSIVPFLAHHHSSSTMPRSYPSRSISVKRDSPLSRGIEAYVKENKCDLDAVYLSTRRVAQEIEELKTDPVLGVTAGPMNDDLMKWVIVIEGPVGTPYEGGTFFVDLLFPANYPLFAPSLLFRTRIFHPNINCETGAVYVDCIANNWNVNSSIRHILQDLCACLSNPNPNNGLSLEATALLKNDPYRFQEAAKKCTIAYA